MLKGLRAMWDETKLLAHPYEKELLYNLLKNPNQDVSYEVQWLDHQVSKEDEIKWSVTLQRVKQVACMIFLSFIHYRQHFVHLSQKIIQARQEKLISQTQEKIKAIRDELQQVHTQAAKLEEEWTRKNTLIESTKVEYQKDKQNKLAKEQEHVNIDQSIKENQQVVKTWDGYKRVSQSQTEKKDSSPNSQRFFLKNVLDNLTNPKQTIIKMAQKHIEDVSIATNRQNIEKNQEASAQCLKELHEITQNLQRYEELQRSLTLEISTLSENRKSLAEKSTQLQTKLQPLEDKLASYQHPLQPDATSSASLDLDAWQADAQDRMAQTLSQAIHPQFADLWNQPFKIASQGRTSPIVRAWHYQEASGQFSLVLEESFKLWVASTNHEGRSDPPGGVVLLFEDPNGQSSPSYVRISGSIDEKNKTIHFVSSNFQTYCQANRKPVTNQRVKSAMTRMAYDTQTQSVTICASAKVNLYLFNGTFSGSETTPLECLIKNWQKGELVSSDLDAVLTAKKLS